MFCTRCGIEIDEKVRYCSTCGHPTKLAEATANPYASPRLALDTEHKKIAGVCAGFRLLRLPDRLDSDAQGCAARGGRAGLCAAERVVVERVLEDPRRPGGPPHKTAAQSR